MPIRFGTDGWRAVIADDYTFENVRRVAQATALFWKSEKRKKTECYSWKPGSYACTYRPAEAGFAVGYDARFLSESFAREAAKVLAAYGIPVWLSKTVVPTPTLSQAIADQKLSGGVMITASHNPYQWNGFKIKMEFAGSALPLITKQVEEELDRLVAQNAPVLTTPQAPIEEVDFHEPYLKAVRERVDLKSVEKQSFKIMTDPLYGTDIGLVKRLMPKINLEEIHAERNPLFPGLNPEPIDLNLHELMRLVPSRKADVGLSFDGDGDRIGAVDEAGNFLASHEILCLLIWHLVKHRKWSGGIVKTFSCTNRVKLLAEYFNLPFHETPIGFKNVAQLFLTEDILIGGEESGGIGMKNHIPERDGLFNGLMLLELMAATGKPLGKVLNEIHKEIGTFYTDRIDLHVAIEKRDAVIRRLSGNVPARLDSLKVDGTSALDGIKYLLERNSWILFRPSGTEPLIRIYAEASSKPSVKQLLEAGRKLVEEDQD